jgi:hypothetical protein
MLNPWARLVFDTLLPAQAHPALALGLFDTGFDDFWLDFQRSAPLETRRALQVALLTATWISPLLIGRLPPLGRHDQSTRERALAALETARLPVLRQLLSLLKLVASLGYGAHPAVRAASGHPGSTAAEAG